MYTRKFLLHPKDIVTVPRIYPTPPLGSLLSLDRVLEVGSRDFALRPPSGQRLSQVRCALTVLEHTAGPLEVVVKKKRRKGYRKRIESVSLYTRLRVGDIDVLGTEVAPDEEAPVRTLDRPVEMAYDQYRATDMSMRGRVASKFGIVRKRMSEEDARAALQRGMGKGAQPIP